MRTFQAAAAVFCLACICTETVTLLVGSGWARRCIKALAGLYILIVLLQLLPSARTELGKWTVPQSTPVSLPGLEAQLESECRQQFGLDAVIRVILEQDGQTLQAVRASMTVPAGSSTALCREAADYLQQRLGVEPSLQTEEETGT
mgnify:FL=1